MEESWWMWVAFYGIVVSMLLLDLGLFRRRPREIGVRESLYYSAFYIAVALCYGAGVYVFVGSQEGNDFLTGYLVEKSLSLDNIFVISLAFKHFHIPRIQQHRVLVYGIAGVLILRGLMIGVGTTLIHQFHSILYLFGVFLIITGVRMLYVKDEDEESLEESKILIFLKRYIKVTPHLHGDKFFVREADNNNIDRVVRKATPLFIALVFIEIADAVFALDSVPAIFAITDNTFVVFTSNVFAILGLRALYFALSAMLHRFSHLKYALALVLVFIGTKIFLPFIGFTIPSNISLLITLSILVCGVLFSLNKTKQTNE